MLMDEACKENAYNVVGLCWLAIGGSESLPAGSDVVASVPRSENIERDIGLGALTGHESGTAIEGDSIDDERALVATVADDVDSR